MNQLSGVTTRVQTQANGDPLPCAEVHPDSPVQQMDEARTDHDLVLRNIFSSAPIGLYRTDPSGIRLNGLGSGTGTEQSDDEAETLVDFMHPQDRKAITASWKSAMESGLQWSQQFRHRSADGRVSWLHAVIGQIKDSNGAVMGYQGCNIDVTAQVEAHDELVVSENRHRVALVAANAGIWDLDLVANDCYFSPYCFELLGYKWGQVPGCLEDWTNIMHPDYLEAARRVKDECVNGVVQEFELEFRLKTNEGKWRWYRCNGKSPRRDSSGRALRLVGTLVDINQSKMMEQLLRMEHDLLNLITTTSPVGIMFVEPDGNIAFANPRAELILGLPRREIMLQGANSPLWSINTRGRDADSATEPSLGQILKTSPTLLNACFEFNRPDGVSAMISISSAPFLDRASKISGTVLTLEDVTEQKRHEQALLDSDRLLRETQRIAQLGSYVLDLAQDSWNCSSKLAEILGIDESFPRTLRGHFEIVHEDCRELFMESYLASVATSRPFEMEYKIRRHSDGIERWVAECCELNKEAAGKQARMIGTIKDITERKADEEAIRNLNGELDRRVIERTSQLAAAKKEIESFSYSVSHDLRAPLRHINSYSAILVEEHGSSLSEEARSYLERICTASSRMGKQIDDLLTLTRVGRAVMNRQAFNISQSAAEVAEMLRSAEQGCTAKFVVQDGLFANGDSALVRMVLQNLLGNSVKYTARKPAPLIEFGQRSLPGRQTFFVRDNGVGFDMAYVEKLFQPFQRLHGSEFEGTGIGLATVRRIIERHGGSIWAEAKENEGATFYFTLSQPRNP